MSEDSHKQGDLEDWDSNDRGKNVSAQQLEESPDWTIHTAGLTSADQLVGMTGAITFDMSNITSVVPQSSCLPKKG